MIQRKELKKQGKKVVKRSYWHVVVICFLIAFVAGGYSQGGTLTLFTSYDDSKEVGDALQSNLEDAKQNNVEIVRDLLDSAGIRTPDESTPVQESKYTRGVFASIFNNVTSSKSFVFGLLNVLNQSIFHGRIVYGLVLFIGLAIMAMLWFFISNMLIVGQSRFFMEASLYDKTSAKRVLFLISIHRWFRACAVMFFAALYQFLWDITIIGGIIKRYSYLMVPYIVAENPNVTPKEAITLSCMMMKRNKWKAFVIDLSFVGWNFLGVITFGLLSIFYVNPYRAATKTQFYFAVRDEAIQNHVKNYELLNDPYLTRQPVEVSGETEKLHQYPVELFTIPEGRRRKLVHVDYMRSYTVWSLILLFIIFSVVGWLWEVSLHLGREGFVNRGVLHGPWLPIYGSGGVLVLILLKKVRQKPWLTFLLTLVTCGFLEYYTSWYLETFKGHKWWDYSGYFLNLDGRICAEGLLVFGIGGCAFIYLFAPLLDELIRKIPVKVQIILCVTLMGAFLADEAYSSEHPNTGRGVTDYAWQEYLPKRNKEKKMG